METVKSIQEKIKELLVQIHSLKADKTKAQKNALPGGCYFLSEDEVLCENDYSAIVVIRIRTTD